MRTATVVCQDCGYEKRMEVLTDKELRDPEIRKFPIRCDKCGSSNVRVR